MQRNLWQLPRLVPQRRHPYFTQAVTELERFHDESGNLAASRTRFCALGKRRLSEQRNITHSKERASSRPVETATTAEASPGVTRLDHLVVLVHGANTDGIWEGVVEPELEKAGFTVVRTSYGNNVSCLLSPREKARDEAIVHVLRDIRDALRNYKVKWGHEPLKKSVIGHSFGCYVICQTLVQATELEWDRIVFCGSVVRNDFEFNRVSHQFGDPLLNLVGTLDYYPVLAAWINKRLGSSGSTGLNRSKTLTNWHHGLGHGGFLTASFTEKVFVPFLKGEAWHRGGSPQKLPLWLRILTYFSLQQYLLSFVVSAIFILLCLVVFFVI